MFTILPMSEFSGTPPTELCRGCGACCKRLPGSAFPQQFGVDAVSIEAALLMAITSGRWAVDCWEGDPREGRDEVEEAYFIRPATKGKEGRAFDASWGGECTFLGAEGCTLPRDQMPVECKTLTPMVGLKCKQDPRTIKRQAAIEWLPFTEVIERVLSAI